MRSRLETREVLAGAYGPRLNPGRAARSMTMRTHAVRVNADGRDIEVLCTRVQLDNLADAGSFQRRENRFAEPTCKSCAAKWRKAKAC